MTRKFLIAAAVLLAVGGSAVAAPKQQQIQGPAKVANPVRGGTSASIEYKCGNTTYKLSTGNKKGICGVGASVAECTDSNGNFSRVECDVGCKNTKGSGTCETK
jgi:hypothetical protein